MDVGCGSGVIAIYVARYFRKRTYCVDVSIRSLAVARVNSTLNDVSELIRTVKAGEVSGIRPAGLVVTNPPYLPVEPLDELDINWCGGRDLRYLYAIIDTCIKLLANGGSILLTVSSLSCTRGVVRYILKRRLRVVRVAYARTPLDVIYLLHVVRHERL